MIEGLKCVNENVNLKDYLHLYKYVRDNMDHPEWLGTFTKEEIIDILNAIDVLLSLPSNKMIQKQIKNKVLTYPKYQIKTVSKIFSILGMKYYKLELKNGKKKYLFVFNCIY